jgi:guanyl-specific ribonuclease Sa
MRRNGWILVVLAALALWAWQRQGLPAFAGGTQSSAAQSHAGADSAGIDRPGRMPRDDVAGTGARPGSADAASDDDAGRWPAYLPAEARDTLALIESGGPFPHRQDGATFQNREHRLPQRESGYYREYTVETPGSPDRGARRIIAGGDPPAEFFYTEDHYGSFRRFTDRESDSGDASGQDDGNGGAR